MKSYPGHEDPCVNRDKFLRCTNLFKITLLFICSMLLYGCDNSAKVPRMISAKDTILIVYPGINGEKVDWYKASSICAELVAFGHDDWRLPGIEELKIMNDSLDLGNLKPYWSSSETSENYASVMLTGFSDRQILDQNKSTTGTKVGNFILSGKPGNRCRCVRAERRK